MAVDVNDNNKSCEYWSPDSRYRRKRAFSGGKQIILCALSTSLINTLLDDTKYDFSFIR